MHKNRSAALSFVLSLLLGFCAATALAGAAQMMEVELSDGTVIAGEIVSLANGVYTVRSASLGNVQVPESRVRVIRAKGSAGRTEDPGGQVKSLQEKMQGDADIMNIVAGLASDRDFQEILRDPEILKAVQAGDLTALMSNPAFIKLLNKTEVQQIKNRISR